MSSAFLVAPSRHTRSFHNQKTQYGENSIDRAVKSGLITSIDAELIRKFIVELRATRGISVGRANKIIFTVVSWRRFIGEYRQNSIHDLYAGITRLNDARIKGRPYKQNSRRDFLNFLKRFYQWLIIQDYSSIKKGAIEEITSPRRDTMTKTAEQLLSEDQILAMIEACQNSRDRALLAVMYEGGFRVEEMGILSWGQVKFDPHLKSEKISDDSFAGLGDATPFTLQNRHGTFTDCV